MKISPRHALFALALIAATSASAAGPDDSAFLAENEAAMTKMMAAMQIEPSGDVDKDFVAMMTPHHQGAVDMAQALLRYGHNEQLRRLAQEIIVTQQQEIVVMRTALGQPASVPSPSAGQSPSGHSMHMQREP
jgi:uncharacterized protein (DUF305 family)